MLENNRPQGLLDSQGRVIPDTYEEESFRGEYDVNNNLIYSGFARAGANENNLVWQLSLLTYDVSNNLLSITWPQNTFGAASIDYIFSWTDRASYTYS